MDMQCGNLINANEREAQQLAEMRGIVPRP